MSASQSNDTDRRELEQETAGVRITATIAFSLIIFTLFSVALFFGFDSRAERLFLLGIGHLFLAPLAAYGALRLDWTVALALVLSVVVFLLDAVQLVIRLLTIELSIIVFIGIILIAVFVALDAVYIGVLYRLRTTEKVQNSKQFDNDPVSLRLALIRQEANTLRLGALFGGIGSFLWLAFIAIFLGFNQRVAALALLSSGHLLLAPYAALFITASRLLALLFLPLSLAQVSLDAIQLALRLSDIGAGQLTVLSLNNIFTVGFLLIVVAFILLDVVYVVASFGYLRAVRRGAVVMTSSARASESQQPKRQKKPPGNPRMMDALSLTSATVRSKFQ